MVNDNIDFLNLAYWILGKLHFYSDNGSVSDVGDNNDGNSRLASVLTIDMSKFKCYAD